MPFVIHMLAIAVFAQGTSEFMLAGLLPAIADDLGVTVPQAGLLTSSFAVGIVVGAPVMAGLARGWPPRRSLCGFLALFIAAHVIGAVTDDFAVLLVTRVLAAVANAGFLAVALSAVAALVVPSMTARAVAVVLAGTTLALVAGVPGGAAVGVAFGWRSALWGVVAISVPALVGVAVSAPRRSTHSPADRAPLSAEWGVLRRTPVLLALAVAALVNAGTFCAFTYLAPVVTDSAGLPSAAVPLVLAAFGVGAFAGVMVAGRLGDGHPARLILAGGGLLFCGWVAFAATTESPTWVVVFALTQGATAFGVGSALIARVMTVARDAQSLSGASATVALNVGAAAGPILGGMAFAVAPGWGPLLVSAALVGSSLVLTALGRRALFRELA